MRKVICLLIIMLLIIETEVNAHSGGTDANGGHHCWTNCEKWGLEYGEYHSHSLEYKNTPVTQENSTTRNIHTYEEGYNEAFDYWYDKVYKDLEKKKDLDVGWSAEWTDYNKDYSKGYEKGFNEAVEKAQSDFSEGSYEKGYEDGENDYINKDGKIVIGLNNSEKRDISDENEDYIRGYTEGWNNTQEEIKNELAIKGEDKVNTIEIAEKYEEQSWRFKEGYQVGYFDSESEYQYDESQFEDVLSNEKKEFLLGYKTGWNDEGGSLPWGTKIEIIYYIYLKEVGYVFGAVFGAILLGLTGFVIGKKHKRE